MLNVLKPLALTLDPQLLSTTATDSADPDYSAGTTYGVAHTVKYNHRRYESLQAANIGHTPDAVASADWWLDLGPTNWWACLDTRTSTKTTKVGDLVVVLKPSAMFNSVAVVGVSGVSLVKVDVYKNSGRTTGGGGAVGVDLIFTESKSLDNTFVSNWYQWLFEPYDVFTDLLFGAIAATQAGGIPPYYAAEVVVTFTATDPGATVGCGAILLGTSVELGEVNYGASAGIDDYTIKERDAYGELTLVERDYSEKASYTLSVAHTQIRRVHSTLAALRATPAVWVGTTDYNYSPLTVYGIPKDFSLNVDYFEHATYTLEIEGLT